MSILFLEATKWTTVWPVLSGAKDQPGRMAQMAVETERYSLFSFGSAPLLSRNSTSLSLSLTLAAIMSGVQPISSYLQHAFL